VKQWLIHHNGENNYLQYIDKLHWQLRTKYQGSEKEQCYLFIYKVREQQPNTATIANKLMVVRRLQMCLPDEFHFHEQMHWHQQ